MNPYPFATFIAVLVMFIASGLTFNRFSPDHQHLMICLLLSVLLGIMGAWLIPHYPISDITGEIFAAKSKGEKIRFGVKNLLFVTFLFLVITCIGTGSLFTYFYGKATSLSGVVVKVSDGHWQLFSCDDYYSVRTVDKRYFKICTQPRSQYAWHQGDAVEIAVKHSAFGYLAERSNNSFKPTPLRGVDKGR